MHADHVARRAWSLRRSGRCPASRCWWREWRRASRRRRACGRSRCLRSSSSNTASTMTSASPSDCVVERGADQRQALRLVGGRETAAIHHGLIDALDAGEHRARGLRRWRRSASPECRHWRSRWRCRHPWCRRRSRRPALTGARASSSGSPGTRRLSRSAKNTCTAPRDSAVSLALIDARGFVLETFGETASARPCARHPRPPARRCDWDRACAPVPRMRSNIVVGRGGRIARSSRRCGADPCPPASNSRAYANRADAQVALDDGIEEAQFHRLRRARPASRTG